MEFYKKEVQKEKTARKRRKKMQYHIQIYQFLTIYLKVLKSFLLQEELKNMLRK